MLYPLDPYACPCLLIHFLDINSLHVCITLNLSFCFLGINFVLGNNSLQNSNDLLWLYSHDLQAVVPVICA